MTASLLLALNAMACDGSGKDKDKEKEDKRITIIR